MSQADSYCGGDLVAGARIMELFGDAATEPAIRYDGDEGLSQSRYDISAGAAELLGEPVLTTRATSTFVVKRKLQ